MGPEKLDAERRFMRFHGKERAATFEVATHPNKGNYITVKVWGGSEASGSQLMLQNAGKLLHQRKEQPVPGCCYYATHSIPREITEGQKTVEVTIKNKGGTPGADVYNAYTHTGAYVQPPVDELQGEPFELGPPRPDRTARPRRRPLSTGGRRPTGVSKGARDRQIVGEKAKKLIETVPFRSGPVVLFLHVILTRLSCPLHTRLRRRKRKHSAGF